jgi:hypothetical protein
MTLDLATIFTYLALAESTGRKLSRAEQRSVATVLALRAAGPVDRAGFERVTGQTSHRRMNPGAWTFGGEDGALPQPSDWNPIAKAALRIGWWGRLVDGTLELYDHPQPEAGRELMKAQRARYNERKQVRRDVAERREEQRVADIAALRATLEAELDAMDFELPPIPTEDTEEPETPEDVEHRHESGAADHEAEVHAAFFATLFGRLAEEGTDVASLLDAHTAEVESWKGSALRDELRRLGLPVSGRVAELRSRIFLGWTEGANLRQQVLAESGAWPAAFLDLAELRTLARGEV